jgi:hypothetical protein
MRIIPAAVVIALSLAGCAATADDPVEEEAGNVRTFAVDEQSLNKATKSSLPLLDHGGEVLPQSKTYAVYWGPASDFPSDLVAGMAALLGGFDGSSYLGIAQQYMRGAPISTAYAGAVFDASAPPSSAPNANALGSEVCKLFPNPDPSALYIIFTSNAPNIQYCAWHNKTSCNGVTFQVAYMPNQALLPGCSPYTRSNLGCNTYSDGTVTAADSVAHEFMETITDPLIDAWYDKKHGEVADKCNYDYQECVELSTGAWQIQSEWSNALNGCQQQ